MLAQISCLYAAIGPLVTALFVLSRMLARLTFGRLRLLKYYITAQPVPSGALTPPRRGLAIVVTEGTPAQARATAFGRPQAAIEHRLGNGARYVIARRDGCLLGFQWFTLRDYPEDEVRCVFELRPQDRCAWDFDIFVQPEARMLPVFTRLWDCVNAIFREHGIEYSLSRIDAFNQASLRAHARMGARPVASALFLRARRLQLAVLPARPWVHLSWSDSGAPRLAASRLARQRKSRTHFSE